MCVCVLAHFSGGLCRSLHSPCNTEKPELTSIFGSSYIHTVPYMEVNSDSVAKGASTGVFIILATLKSPS